MAFFTTIICSEQVKPKELLQTKNFWARVIFIFVLGNIVRLIILYLGGVAVILDYLHPVSMGCYLSFIIATINSEELLDTLLPDKYTMMGSNSGSNIVGNIDNSSGSGSGSNTGNIGSNTGVYSDIEKARAEEARRKILESNRAKTSSSNLSAA
jgi:hypothetical protein